MKTLERELSRAKVSANRVAVVVANEWKDGNDKVMPVKQWLEERRIVQVSNEGRPSSVFILLIVDLFWTDIQKSLNINLDIAFIFGFFTGLNYGTFC
jgi:hypothetical protein